MIRNTQLFFARETLQNAYDQKDWATVQAMCQMIDRMTIAKNKQYLDESSDQQKRLTELKTRYRAM